MDVFVARQPIFDRKRQLDAYELLYRPDGDHGEFDGTEATSATMQVLASSLFSIGLDSLLGGKRAYLNFDRALLTCGVHSILPPETVVLEILESVDPDLELVAACEELQKQGYTLALDDFVPHDRFEALTQIVKVIKVDMRTTTRPDQERLLRTYQPRGIAMVAEKVETHEEFEWALGAGYDFFQGYFFARPLVVRGRQVPAAKISCLRLLSEVQSSDLNFNRLESMICQDVSLCYKLLRYVNSGLFYRRTEIHSINHALVVLGETGIRHWVALAALPVMTKDKPGELVTHALVRARFCERMAELAGFPEPGQAFLMGLVSLLDAFLDMPLEDALQQVSVDSAIRGALLGTAPENDAFLNIYRSVCRYEAADWAEVGRLAPGLKIKTASVSEAYADSILWAKQALHATGRKANTRRHVRHTVTGSIRILWEDDAGRERITLAKLLNVSVGGLQLQVDEKIPIRCAVTCNDPKLGISGRGSVCYCNFSKGKYLIGLDFSSGTGWREPAALASH
jgi:c-di-GMP-related signal transduction protein